ncbi:NACHT domain-containing protein [Rhizobium gallicum]|uniref:NACHT domain-containing protein n=1 Tax=Rhizobium gallicum TaxID=56730 RepID=UPI001EF96E41|nr:ATP-binding protein [Rhizobium gallicum]ULJ73011.1 ATP-binding protein [Rhizobium gallicum]
MSFEEALRLYHSWDERSHRRDAISVNPETIGRFIPRTVLVAGPGMGKTTLLKRIARRYSEDMVPVLRVRLTSVASRMLRGDTFEEAVFDLGLDGSGVSSADARAAGFRNWLILCDGLDECGHLQRDVAEGVARFAAGHRNCRVLVTTRPVGYRRQHFADWRHYDITSLDMFSARANAERLLEAIVPPGSPMHENATEICGVEFADDTAARKLCRTPLLMALSVAVLFRGAKLATSRERLYEQIFELVNEVPGSKNAVPPAPSVVLHRFLDILGWQIAVEPLAPIKMTLERCALELSKAMGTTPLVAAADVERVAEFWLTVGMIERVGHGSEQALTFIHKSFGEFTAARFLKSMSLAEQGAVVVAHSDSPSWAEVLRLAGMLGMADVVSRHLLGEIGEPVPLERLTFAVEMTAEANPPPTAELRNRIQDAAWSIVESDRRRQALRVGWPLVAASRRFPEEIGTIAARHLHARNPWSRLVAWACVVTAGPSYYALDELMHTLVETVDAVYPVVRSSIGRGYQLDRTKQSEIVQHLALEACAQIIDRAPVSVADMIVPKVLTNENLGSMGFLSKASIMMKLKGRAYQVGGVQAIPSMTSRYLEGYADYAAANLKMFEEVFGALGFTPVEPSSYSDNAPLRKLLHLSAFISSTQMHKVVASDVWGWTRPFDHPATTEVLRGFVEVSGIDKIKLREDAVDALLFLRSEEGAKDHFMLRSTVDVDPPEVQWSNAASLGLDIDLVERAISHPSQWIKYIAANLLKAISNRAELAQSVERLFTTGRKATLWAASGLAKELGREEALPLILKRLASPMVPGCEYLFELLEELRPDHSDDFFGIIRSGLFATDVDVAVSAANLVLKVVRADDTALLAILEQAYSYWLVNEKPYPVDNGVIPRSPRATLIQAMAILRPLRYTELSSYLADPRTDVTHVALPLLVDYMRSQGSDRRQFFEDIDRELVPASNLREVLDAGITLDDVDLVAVETMLNSAYGSVRYAGLAVLTDRYLDRERIIRHATRMTHDSEQQIRDRAFGILDSLK